MSKLTASVILLGLTHSAYSASVGSGGISTAFSKGATSVSALVGSGTAFKDDYVILGVGASYYVSQGFALGVDAEHWISGEPSITKITPKATYVFTQPKKFRPYVGAFYRRTFYGDYKGRSIDDQNSYGYRVGTYFSASTNVYVGGGFVFEKYLDCDARTDCSSTYPELIFSASF